MPKRVTAALGVLLGVLGVAAMLSLTTGASPAAAAEQDLIGSVVDTNGSPVADVPVTVTGPGFDEELTTDSQGTFVAAVPGPGRYTITIDPETVPDDVNVPQRYARGRPVQVTAGEATTLTIELRRAESLRGVMVDEDDEPLEGIEVTAASLDGPFQESTTTDEEGRWEIFVPGGGTYRVGIDPDQLPEGVEVREGTKSELEVPVGSGQQRAVLFAFGEGSRNVLSTWEQAAQLIAEGLRFGLILGLCALGLSLVFGTTGLVNFAHGAMIAFGAVLTFAFNTSGIPFILAAAMAVALTAAAGAAQELGLYRPLRKRRTGLIAMMVVTIGLSFFARFTYLYFIGGGNRSYDDYVIQQGIEIGPISLAPRDYWSMGIALVVLVAFGLLLVFTRIGKAMRAVADNPSLASASGIDVNRVILFVWVTGGAMAGLGGVLLGLSQQVKYDMGFTILLLVFAGTILGGIGTAFGAMAGSIVVGMFVNVSTLWIPPELKNAAAFAALILVLLIRPQGILGRRERVG